MSLKKITAAKLLSLDSLLSAYLEADSNQSALTDKQIKSIAFALDFIPSVFSWWIDKKRDASVKQLNKIEEMYDLFKLDDYEEFLEDERIKDIG